MALGFLFLLLCDFLRLEAAGQIHFFLLEALRNGLNFPSTGQEITSFHQIITRVFSNYQMQLLEDLASNESVIHIN